MLANDKVTPNTCDKSCTETYFNSSPNIVNMSIIDEKRNSSKTIEIGETVATMQTTSTNDQFNCEIINGRPQLLKSESFLCDLSVMSFCTDDEGENELQDAYENKMERGQDSEIYYDSTNDCENVAQEMTYETHRGEEIIKSCMEENDGLLYLNDIEIDSKEEEQTVTELVNLVEQDKLMQGEQNKSLRVAFGVILRLIFPLANGVVQGITGIRDVRFLKVIRHIGSSRHALTNLFAYAANTISLNLSSVQVFHRIGPILKLLKIRVSRDGIESLPDIQTQTHCEDILTSPSSPLVTTPIYSPMSRQPRYSLPNFQASSKKLLPEIYEATKCCTLNILAEPTSGQPIRADIIFIHGLNGSLTNTWKQGLWENERRPVEFQRPPKPPIRPPKRPRHSRSTPVHPRHHEKRARFTHADLNERSSQESDSIEEAEENNYSFVCSEPKDLQICDGIEYSFPTFRLRMQDNGRLLQADHDSKLPDAKHKQNSTEPSEDTNKDDKRKSSKPSPNDPNYSKCWPGDWLPLDCPGVRVLALNYTTDQHLWRPLWKKKEARSNLTQRSREMIELLIRHRVGYGHPIIWVGHSKGGLFIKQIIVDAWESGRPAAAPLWRSARGVFFYSVPHRGSHLASIKAPFLARSVELIDVEKNNKYLLDLHRRFAGLYHLGHLKIEVFSFVETALTLMSVLYLRIVSVDSGDPGIGDVCGIRLDHREICKPRNRDCILYRQLVNMINKVS